MFYRCQLTFELNRMLKLYKNNYKFRILKTVVESLENDTNSPIFFELLNALNKVYNFFLNDICKDFRPTEKEEVIEEVFEQYLRYLNKYSLALGDVNGEFKQQYRNDFTSQLLVHWNKVLYGYDADEKSFIQVFNEMHNGSIAKHPELFTVRLGQLKHLYRTQSGKHFGNYARMIPDPRYTQNNRWNPPGVAFQYLAYGEEVSPYDDSTINMLEKTCFEEFRLKAGSDATVCRFKPIKKDALLINFCFHDVSYDYIEIENQRVMDKMSQQKVTEILNKRKYTAELVTLSKDDAKLKGRIKEIIQQEVEKPQIREKILEETEKYIGKLMMKHIDEAVFLPVFQEYDPDLKAYIPFHHFANFLQSKGYAGVIYRSTRMDLIGLQGKNVVLFNPADVEPQLGSMRVYHFDGAKYQVLQD